MSRQTENIKVNAITITTIFEASALNRDEKLGGNIPSIKKLTRFGNRVFSYLSRVAIRHYLFRTLNERYQNDWTPAKCIPSEGGDNKVVQFDLRSQNILTHAELDAFGYMFTIGGQQSLTRKAPVGITKAVALETWEGDMQFNANHDLARRCGADPNPVNKEEQEAFFKVSFTVDVKRIGYDEWLIDKHEYDSGQEMLRLVLSKDEKVNHEIRAKLNGGKYIVLSSEATLGEIEIGESGKNAVFILNDTMKTRRILQIVNSIKNGLIYHSSGENYGIVPQFIIAAGLYLPVPIFHSFVELGKFESSIFDNDYILSNNGKKLVYVYNPKKLVEIDTTNLYTDWDKFLSDLGINDNHAGS